MAKKPTAEGQPKTRAAKSTFVPKEDFSADLIGAAKNLEPKKTSYPVKIVPAASLPAKNGSGLPAIVTEAERAAAQTETAQAAGPATFTPLYQGDPTDIAPGDLHQARVSKYGEGYVVTTNGTNQQIWTALAWKQIRGSVGGYKPAARVPEEVREMMAGK